MLKTLNLNQQKAQFFNCLVYFVLDTNCTVWCSSVWVFSDCCTAQLQLLSTGLELVIESVHVP